MSNDIQWNKNVEDILSETTSWPTISQLVSQNDTYLYIDYYLGILGLVISSCLVSFHNP